MRKPCVAAGNANHIEMIYVTNIRRLVRRYDIGAKKQFVVGASVSAPRLSPFLKMRKLGSQNCRLKRINPLTIAENFMFIFGLAAMVA